MPTASHRERPFSAAAAPNASANTASPGNAGSVLRAPSTNPARVKIEWEWDIGLEMLCLVDLTPSIAPPANPAERTQALQTCCWSDLERAQVDHLQSHVENDDQAHIGDPAVALENAGNERGCKSHKGDGQDQTEDHHIGMLPGGARNGQNVVEGHGHVGNDDLPRCLREGLAGAARGARFRAFQAFEGQFGSLFVRRRGTNL